jgi:formylglycine-generating enzyme required for sulfatase activity
MPLLRPDQEGRRRFPWLLVAGGAVLVFGIAAVVWKVVLPINGKPEKPEPELVNSLGMRLVLIPAGEFQLGSPGTDSEAAEDEKPQHRVQIPRPFYLGAHEVTVGNFRAFINAEKYATEAEKDGRGGWGFDEKTKHFDGPDPRYSWRDPGFSQSDDHPVVNVTWNDAKRFCEWLSAKEGRAYRLPREAEWEYACRAGAPTRFSTGDDGESLAEVANIADASFKERFPDWTTIGRRDGHVFTAPVGSFPPNAFGLYDMHGNVCEWCEDSYAKDAYKPGSSSTSAPGGSRVMRGGSFMNSPAKCRAAARGQLEPGVALFYLGFRVVLEP